MEAFWKAAAMIILTVILGTAIGKNEKEITILLSVAACCGVSFLTMQYLSEVVSFLWQMGNNDVLQNPFVRILLRITGVTLITELLSAISSDAGNTSMGKTIQILGNAVILFQALPIFESLMSLIQEILSV